MRSRPFFAKSLIFLILFFAVAAPAGKEKDVQLLEPRANAVVDAGTVEFEWVVAGDVQSKSATLVVQDLKKKKPKREKKVKVEKATMKLSSGHYRWRVELKGAGRSDWRFIEVAKPTKTSAPMADATPRVTQVAAETAKPQIKKKLKTKKSHDTSSDQDLEDLSELPEAPPPPATNQPNDDLLDLEEKPK